VGVVPGARLWAVRVLNDKGFGHTSTILCGIDFVTATRTDSDPTNDIVVGNMSLAGAGSDDGACGTVNKDPIHKAICASVAAGVSYVVAAGNGGRDFQTNVPASYDEVGTVTAVTDLDGLPGALASSNATCLPGFPLTDDSAVLFSDFATLPADQAHVLAAPGVCILSAFGGGTYDTISGTSQSAPHVAGTVALCIASGVCAGLAPAQIIQKLRRDATAYNTANPGYGFTGDPLHSPDPNKYYGYLIRAGLY
jgi:subtilisin